MAASALVQRQVFPLQYVKSARAVHLWKAVETQLVGVGVSYSLKPSIKISLEKSFRRVRTWRSTNHLSINPTPSLSYPESEQIPTVHLVFESGDI